MLQNSVEFVFILKRVILDTYLLIGSLKGHVKKVLVEYLFPIPLYQVFLIVKTALITNLIVIY